MSTRKKKDDVFLTPELAKIRRRCKAAREVQALRDHNPRFVEFARTLPDVEDAKLLAAWGWVTEWTEAVIRRTLRDFQTLPFDPVTGE